jgi:hypothetical protein
MGLPAACPGPVVVPVRESHRMCGIGQTDLLRPFTIPVREAPEVDRRRKRRPLDT